MEKPLGERHSISLTPRLPPLYSADPSSAVQDETGSLGARRRPAGGGLACERLLESRCAIARFLREGKVFAGAEFVDYVPS